MKNLFLKSVLFAFIAALLATPTFASESKVAVTFQTERSTRDGRTQPPWDFAGRGIDVRHYDRATLNEKFVNDLAEARLLVLDVNSRVESIRSIFKEKQWQDAIRAFLARGGIIFCQFDAFPAWWGDADGKAFMEELGIVIPPRETFDGRYDVAVADGLNHPLLTSPHRLKDVESTQVATPGGNFIADPPAPWKVLIHRKNNPSHATVLIQEGIAGRGAIIISSYYNLIKPKTSRGALGNQLLENVLHRVFGELERGQAVNPVPSVDATLAAPPVRAGTMKAVKLADESNAANPLYLRGLIGKPWSIGQGQWRLPVVVRETRGVDRPRSLVAITHPLPAGATPGSIQVVTPWGEPVASQAHVTQSNTVEIVFAADLAANEHRCFFVYFDTRDHSAVPTGPLDSVVRHVEHGEYITVSNDFLSFTVRTDSPVVTDIRPIGSPTGNQFFQEADLVPEAYGARLQDAGVVASKPARIVETGPVRVVIEYEAQHAGSPLLVRFALHAGARHLDYAFRAPRNGTLRRSISWLPGKGITDGIVDSFYFPHESGLRRLPVTFHSAQLVETVTPSDMGLVEGWYAFEDTETSQLVGEIFELGDVNSLMVYIGAYRGYRASVITSIGDRSTRGGLTALSPGAGVNGMREVYANFKYPPAVLVGSPQTPGDAPSEPAKPIYGKNLIRSYHLNYQSKGRSALEMTWPDDPNRMIPHMIQRHQARGANYFSLWAHQPFWPSRFTEPPRTGFLSELVQQSHASGMGVAIGTAILRRPMFYGKAVPEGFDGDKLRFKDLITEVAREIGKTNADFYSIFDEELYRIEYAHGERVFREKYGMEPVPEQQMREVRLNPALLAEPRYRNTALHRIEVYTDLLRAMVDAVRENNPNMILSDQVNQGAMSRIDAGAPHDWEVHAQFLSTLTMDLYGQSQGYKYDIKFMRGAFNNAAPVGMFHGGPIDLRFVESGLHYTLMWGIDALFLFPPRSLSRLAHYDTVARNYHWLDYTGLGDKMASYEPVKHVAVLRDRAAMLDDIAHGRWQTGGTDHDCRARNVVFLNNLQTDIVFAKDVNVENLSPYRLVFVNSNRVMSDDQARAIAAYVHGGGVALIEGDTLRNPIIAELCGARPNGATAPGNRTVSGPGGFRFAGSITPVEAAGAAIVLAADDHAPVLLTRNHGKGKVVYSPCFLSDRLQAQQDVTRYFRSVVDELAGPLPIVVEAPVGSDLDTNLMTDGENFVLVAWNPDYAARTLTIRTSGPTRPEVVARFDTGDIHALRDQWTVEVPSHGFRHLFLGSRATIAPPKHHSADGGRVLGYSSRPMLDMVDFQPPAATKSAVGAKSLREKEPGYRYIGILTDDDAAQRSRITGEHGIYTVLQPLRGIKAEYIRDLNADTLAFYDAVIVPNTGLGVPPQLTEGWEERLREYAANGGGVLLCHHAVGFRVSQHPPLPQVGRPQSPHVIVQKMIRISAEHPITTGQAMRDRYPAEAVNPAFVAEFDALAFDIDETFETGFLDYVPLTPAAGAQVVAHGQVVGGVGGEPVIVAGTIGKGRVVLTGLGLGERITYLEDGKMERGEQTTDGDRRLLVNIAYWLTER